jgi:hypothetical protein
MVTNQNNIKKISKDLILKFKKFPTVIMGLGDKEKILKIIPMMEGEQI